jgi:3',5'-cyclic AMP phosphodiesterase CpdA
MGLPFRIAIAVLLPSVATAQSSSAGSAADTTIAVASLPPATPLPAEAATAGVTKFSFIMYGDTRGRHDGVSLESEHTLVVESMLATIRAAAAKDPIRFVVQSGDAVQNGAIGRQLTVSYVPLVNRLTQDGGVPYFLAVGNHDVGNAVALTDTHRLAGLRNYFATNARLIPPERSPRRLAGYPTYAFGYGNTFFVALDSDIPDDSTQLAWLKGQLEGLDRRRYVNVALFFHHPPFSSGPHGGARVERQAASIRARWMPLIRQHHVRLLMTGHEHLFEHWVERYTDASGPHRIDEIVSGGGGAPLYGYTGEPDLRDYITAGATQKVTVEHLVRPAMEPGANPFHYVIVHVDGTRINVEVVAVDWGRGFAPYRSNAASLTDVAP